MLWQWAWSLLQCIIVIVHQMLWLLNEPIASRVPNEFDCYVLNSTYFSFVMRIVVNMSLLRNNMCWFKCFATILSWKLHKSWYQIINDVGSSYSQLKQSAKSLPVEDASLWKVILCHARLKFNFDTFYVWELIWIFAAKVLSLWNTTSVLFYFIFQSV